MHGRRSHFHCWRCGFHWTQFCAFYKSWTSYIISLLISAEYTSFTPTKKLDKEMWNVLLAEPTGHLKNSKVNQISMDWVGCRIQSEDRRCTLDICIIVMSIINSHIVCCWFDSIISEGKGLSARTRQWAKRVVECILGWCILGCFSHFNLYGEILFFCHLNHYCS